MASTPDLVVHVECTRMDVSCAACGTVAPGLTKAEAIVWQHAHHQPQVDEAHLVLTYPGTDRPPALQVWRRRR